MKSRVEGKATIESPGGNPGPGQEDSAGREGDSSGFEMRARASGRGGNQRNSRNKFKIKAMAPIQIPSRVSHTALR